MTDRTLADLRRWLGQPDRESGSDEPSMAEETLVASIEREVEFSGYTEDCRLFGFVRLIGERLSDMLNASEQVLVDSVLAVALSDNRAIELPEFLVERSEIVAVRASGPRGNAGRRTRTRPTPVAMRAGPYLIHGYLHSPPGGDAIHQLRRRGTMVPVTQAWMEYEAGGAPHRARIGPLIVNRDFVDWVHHAKDTDVRVDLPVETRIDPRAKDLTGNVRVIEKAERLAE